MLYEISVCLDCEGWTHGVNCNSTCKCVKQNTKRWENTTPTDHCSETGKKWGWKEMIWFKVSVAFITNCELKSKKKCP